MASVQQNIESHPIGVFDSGLGGLTVVRELRRHLPHETIIYFGDIARLPYGIKSKQQIIEFSKQNSDFLAKQGIKALVVACNTSASVSLPALRKSFKLPVIDVIFPAARRAAGLTQAGRIGVIGTTATIQSGAYDRAIRRLAPKVKVFSAACPLFVPLVEEGWTRDGIAEDTVKKYLSPLVRQNIDVLVLGCTHYPMLKGKIQQFVGPRVKIVDSALPTVNFLKDVLHCQGALASPNGKPGALSIFVSDFPRNFIRIGERFLGQKMNSVEVVRLK
ncbi:MAG: glutamate racemase [Candidatus Omnitrophica bacterium]|nr:glutamate racemase [Candidatus Omnitrophota bacterium]